MTILQSWLSIITFTVAAAVLLLPPQHAFAEKEKESIESAREAVSQWVETQRVISQEKRDLALSREMLNERMELVKREIETLRGKISETEKSIDEANKKRSEMIEQNDKLKNSSSAFLDTIIALEARTLDLLKKVPPPLQERVKPLSQRIPTGEVETKISISERYQNVIGILNEIDKAHRDITVTSEVRTLPDGSSAEVTALYLGLGQAYYVGANGTIAGIGRASEAGWEWIQANEHAATISQAIAILKNEQVAAFVQLPVEIK